MPTEKLQGGVPEGHFLSFLFFFCPHQIAGPVKQNKRAHRKPQLRGKKCFAGVVVGFHFWLKFECFLSFFSFFVKCFLRIPFISEANTVVSRGMTGRMHVEVLLTHGAFATMIKCRRSCCRSHRRKHAHIQAHM